MAAIKIMGNARTRTRIKSISALTRVCVYQPKDTNFKPGRLGAPWTSAGCIPSSRTAPFASLSNTLCAPNNPKANTVTLGLAHAGKGAEAKNITEAKIPAVTILMSLLKTISILSLDCGPPRSNVRCAQRWVRNASISLTHALRSSSRYQSPAHLRARRSSGSDTNINGDRRTAAAASWTC